jgi:O-antigen ligase
LSTSALSRLSGPGWVSWAARYALFIVLAALVGVICAAALQAYPADLTLVLAGSASLLIALALAVGRYDAAVALAFVLMAVVKLEPAPVDGLLAVILAVALVTGRFDVRPVPLVVLTCVGLFLMLNVVSAVDAVDPGRAAFFFATTLYLCSFAVWLPGYLSSPRRSRIVVRAYVAAALASAVAGSLSLITGAGANLLTSYDATRVSALFKDPNVFGPFLVPAALILLEESISPRLLTSRPVVKRLCFLLLLVGILFSYSRAAWLNVVVATVVMLVVLASRRRSGTRALGLLAVIMIAVVAIGATVAFTASAPFLESRAQVQSYDTHRFEAQRQGVHFGEQYPFGIGPGQFEYRAPLASHSTYVRVLAEQGLGGFLLFTLVLVATLVFAVRNAVLGRDTHGIGSAALLGAWCGILANSVVVDTLHWRHLWFVAAMIWAGTAAGRLRPGRRAAGH